MNPQFIRNSILALIGIFLLVVMYSCANMASPNGGPYDEKPPRFIASTPLPNQTNFKGNKVEIEFDELIQIENPMENVIVTPHSAFYTDQAVSDMVEVALASLKSFNTTNESPNEIR